MLTERESDNLKIFLCRDRSLKLEIVNLESQVIVEKHATVNMFLGLAHTARHAAKALVLTRPHPKKRFVNKFFRVEV